MKETDPEKLALLYERFRDVCLVEKELWYEVLLMRTPTQGPVLTNRHDRYEVVIDDPAVAETLEANIPLGAKALEAAIREYRDHISFIKKS
jgi:hypothetical protein